MKHFLNIAKYLMLALSLLALTACGGGGGGGGEAPIQPAGPAQAVISLALTGGSDVIGSISVDIDLPEGFSLPVDVDGELIAGILGTNLQNATVLAKYQPEDALTVGHLRLVFIDFDGFSPGEFATLIRDMTLGEVLPLAVGFTVSNLTVTGLDTTELFGYNLDITVQSQVITP